MPTIPTPIKAGAALGFALGVGFGIGRKLEATRPLTADGYTPISLTDHSMVSVHLGGGEVVNVYTDANGTVCTEFPLSNVEVSETFNEWMFDDRVVTNTFKVRNDYHTARLLHEDLGDPTDEEMDEILRELEDEDTLDPFFYDDEYIDLMARSNDEYDEMLASE